mgnify:CR=1 FL=1
MAVRILTIPERFFETLVLVAPEANCEKTSGTFEADAAAVLQRIAICSTTVANPTVKEVVTVERVVFTTEIA